MQIGLLLQKYAKLGFASKRIREIVMETMNDTFAFGLESKDVEIKDGEVKIKVSGVRKFEFTLKREIIEKTLQDNLSKEGFSVSKIF